MGDTTSHSFLPGNPGVGSAGHDLIHPSHVCQSGATDQGPIYRRETKIAEAVARQHAAIIQTMVECAKRHGHNPEAWFTDVLERPPAMTHQDDLSVLLPSNWQPAAPATAPLRETCPA